MLDELLTATADGRFPHRGLASVESLLESWTAANAGQHWAHENGCTRCDLYGAPSSRFIDDKSHPLHGVGQFKTGFNSEVTDYLGVYQIPAKRVRAWLIRQLELSIERARHSRLLNTFSRAAPQPNPDHVWLH